MSTQSQNVFTKLVNLWKSTPLVNLSHSCYYIQNFTFDPHPGASGMGCYHGRWSFETFSHKRGCLLRGWALERIGALRYPPYSDTSLSWLRWATTTKKGSCAIMWRDVVWDCAWSWRSCCRYQTKIHCLHCFPECVIFAVLMVNFTVPFSKLGSKTSLVLCLKIL